MSQGKTPEYEMRYNKSSTYEELKSDIEAVKADKTKLKEKFADRGDFRYCNQVYNQATKCMKKYAKFPEMRDNL